MKSLFVTLISLAFLLTSVNKKEILIEWSEDYSLKWSDFKGKPDNAVKFKAMTYSRIGLDANFEQDHFDISVNTYFLSDKSWTKEKESTKLLAHEQVHFDIAEVVARRLRKAYSEYESTNLDSTSAFLQKTYNHYYGPVWDSYLAYDEETNHGLIEEEQEKWTEKINKELKELKAFSSPVITIPHK